MAKKKNKEKKGPGRPKGTTKHTNEIQKQINYAQLDPIDRAILIIVLAKPAISNNELAKQMGMDSRTIKNRRDRGIFQVELEKIQRPAIQKCKEAQSEAADVIIDLLRSEDEKIRLAAAQSILKPILPNTSIVKTDSTIDMKINSMTPEQLNKFIEIGVEILNIDQNKIIEGEIIKEDKNGKS